MIKNNNFFPIDITNLFKLRPMIFMLIIFQIIIFFFLSDRNYFFSPILDEGDAYSFYNYNYTSLENFFSQYRSFGGPLIVKIYKFFSVNMVFWAEFNYIFFCISLIFLFTSLYKYKYNKLFTLFFVTGILGSVSLWSYYSSWSEVVSVSFIIITFCFYLKCHNQNSTAYCFFFSIFLFFTYQIRPLFIVYVLSFVFLEIYFIRIKNKKKLLNFNNSKIIFSAVSPLILFLIIRFLITGHLGIAPYLGAHIGAHSLFYLNKEKIDQISNENKSIANKILLRKTKHQHPCNLDYQDFKLFKKNYYFQCYTENTMSLMLEMIKEKKNKEPFDKDDDRNFNSWQHVKTLDKFFMTVNNYNLIDKNLKNLSIEILKINLTEFSMQSIFSFIKSYKLQFLLNRKLILIYIFLIIITIFQKFFLNKIFCYKKNNFEVLKHNELLIFFLASNMLSILILSIIHLPKPRIISVQGIFFIPIVFSYIVGKTEGYLARKKYNSF